MKYPPKINFPHKWESHLRLILLYLITALMLCSAQLQASIFETLPESGEFDVSLHPGETVVLNAPTIVAFGVPFPRSLVDTTDQIKVVDEFGNDIPADVRETMRWHSLSGDPQVRGIRSVVILLEASFSSYEKKSIRVMYGQGSGSAFAGPINIKQTWVSTELGEEDVYPDNEGLFEPSVYATLPPSWMSKAVTRTPFIPKENVSPEFQWQINALENFGKTSINEVGESVSGGQIIQSPIDQRSPWLFDRAGVYWDAYYKTGELYWLRAAHKASQYYAGRVRDDGVFSFATWNDPKYSFSGGLMGDLIMTGDVSLISTIRNIAHFQERNNFFLNNINQRGWNERFYTYWMLGALSAFEVTGEQRYRLDVIERAEHLFMRALSPIGGWSAEGGVLHSKVQHDGGGGALYQQEPVISPWMSALLADAVWRYYLHSEDDNALIFLADLADGVVEHGLYTSRLNGVDYVVPHYLSSGQINPNVYSGSGFGDRFTDGEHALDVTGLIARGVWAKKKLGRDGVRNLLAAIEDLRPTIEYTFNKWTRLRGTPPQTKHVLRPPRSFNWWFGTTSDLEWLLTSEPDGTVTPPPEPVAAPTNLQTSIVDGNSVVLTWNDRAGNEIAYLLERAIQSGDFTQIAVLDAQSEMYTDSAVSTGLTYLYRVRAQADTNRFSPYSNTAQVTLEDDEPVDEVDLATPVNFAVTQVTSDQVALSWIDNSRTETHFEIQRSVNDAPFRWYQRLAANTTNFTDQNVQANTRYRYRIRAIIFQVETSEYSAPISVVTPDDNTGGTPPSPPGNLTATGITDSSVMLSWTDNADNERSLNVERSINARDYIVLAELAANTSAYQDQSLEPGLVYYYRVQAVNEAGGSEYSNVIRFATDTGYPPLATPTGLSAKSLASGSVRLTWNDVSSAETHFEIQRSVNGGSFRWYQRLASNITSYTDKSVMPGKRYAYRVRAIDFQVDATEYSAPVSIVARQRRFNSVASINMLLLDQ